MTTTAMPYRPFGVADTATIHRGLAWLYETVQPDDAIVFHLGPTSCVVNHRHYGFIPSVINGLPVVTMCLAEEHKHARIRIGNEDRLAYPIHRAEVSAIQRAIETEVTVQESWNGEGCETVSFRLSRPANPSLLAALKRYNDGCQQCNGTVFCHDTSHTWHEDFNKLVVPDWPVAA